MKFAKHLEDAAVPEWKAKYLDYKLGKKLIKRCSQEPWPSDTDGNTVSGELCELDTEPINYGTLGSSGVRRHQARVDARGESSNTGSGEDTRQSRRSRLTPERANTGLASKAERTFYNYVEEQLEKIDDFYRNREQDAEMRLTILKSQLQEMKDRQATLRKGVPAATVEPQGREYSRRAHVSVASRFRDNVKSFLAFADDERLAKHPVKQGRRNDTHTQMALTYKVARRRLKTALQEYYYSLELLQSYRSLNKQALRKILKKFDKATHAKVSAIYLENFSNKRYIGYSNAVDALQHQTEIVFAQYYCKGDRKASVVSLRQKERTEDDRFTMLRVGLYAGLSVPLLLEGLVKSLDQKSLMEPVTRLFLMQVWAAFFLLILTTILFGLNCYVWQANKISYPFVFEFDHNHHLNWTQFFEVPGIVLFVFSLYWWMCFSEFFPGFATWYPLLFVCTTILILFAPVRSLHWSSRRWLITAFGRLLVPGLALVRFQDVFLGDVLNSLTYSFGNTSLFWCLYRYDWKNPRQCGSSQSMLFGFFTAVPGILRFLHCLRRYADTLHWFPHLINAMKYLITIIVQMTLSLWRIHGGPRYKIAFITFAIANSIFTAFWDLNYDASLLQMNAKPKLLRNQRAYKSTWIYYSFIVVDPILRCSWIFYVIYENDKQHAAALSFYIALAEVFRRTLWSLLRVENEHVANVRLFRASRELPLPYAIDEVILSLQATESGKSDTRKPQPKLAEAHATDFSRKLDAKSMRSAGGSDSDEEDDEV